ncbi:Ig-like domain-containing protein [Aestuariibacter sp. AA17]|uniref:Ig-like domain-containing protein n=1 Tax=Fluctibacter corallii TaxID=2984329 RepID=A0ABT3A9N8_9ALTE|nr:Ig-like domain-containing protein [Aestuariibacter sp. AA17]MCV2885302.1 Ig-like domain-containing protein [Aestuariibacter sp. AA17]
MKKIKLAGYVATLLSSLFVSGNSYANSPPQFTSPDPFNLFIFQGDPITFTLRANDADGDYLTWSFTQHPYLKKGTLRHWSGGGFTYTPYSNQAGEEMILITVSDGKASDSLYVKFYIEPTRTHYLDVRRHPDVSITNAEVDTILSNASALIKSYDGYGDTACNTKMKRNGNVSLLLNHDGSIDSDSEFNKLPDGVNVVSEINYCGGLKPNIIGCGSKPGKRIAVVRRSSNEDVLWAHEKGHNVGLSHRDSDTNAVMYPSIGHRHHLNVSECNAFRNN